MAWVARAANNVNALRLKELWPKGIDVAFN
jgi:hypothetical protein